MKRIELWDDCMWPTRKEKTKIHVNTKDDEGALGVWEILFLIVWCTLHFFEPSRCVAKSLEGCKKAQCYPSNVRHQHGLSIPRACTNDEMLREHKKTNQTGRANGRTEQHVCSSMRRAGSRDAYWVGLGEFSRVGWPFIWPAKTDHLAIAMARQNITKSPKTTIKTQLLKRRKEK
mgnify:CR=1 FL=1